MFPTVKLPMHIHMSRQYIQEAFQDCVFGMLSVFLHSFLCSWYFIYNINIHQNYLAGLVLEMFAFNALSSHLEWTNQEAFKGSKDTAEVEVPQAGIVLIGFGGGAFSKVHVHYCVWFWKHLLSMYSIVFTSGMDQSVSQDIAEVEVPQACIVLIGFGGGAFSKVHVLYCVWFWKHLLSMYSIVFTSGMDQSVSQDIAEVEVPQACIVLIGFGGGAFSKVHVHYCVCFWEHLLSVYSIVFTSGLDQRERRVLSQLHRVSGCSIHFSYHTRMYWKTLVDELVPPAHNSLRNH